MAHRRHAAIFVAVTFVAAHGALAQEPFPGLDAYVSKAAQTWKVPGLSVAIVHNDSVIYAKGFGTLSAIDHTPVNDQTLFEIGSTTKAFTSTLAAMLVTDGKLRWTDRLSVYLPDFRLNDPAANEGVTIRDALSHQAGIGRAELLWLGSGATRDQVVHRLRFLKAESPFRSRFSYQNVMYTAGGEAVSKAGGAPWEELVRQRIFLPLGMASTVAARADLPTKNAALPHGVDHDTAFVQSPFNSQNVGPAGAIISTARDMAQWVRFQLNDGVVGGKRLVASAALRETHSPQALMVTGAGRGGGDSAAVTNFSTYGMGWRVEDYRHQLLWDHSGGTLGMTCHVAMLPEKKFGVVVLSNMGSTTLPEILADYILDRALGAPVRDPSGDAYARLAAQRRRADSLEKAQAAQHPVDAKPPLPLNAYVGTYADSVYGEATVSINDGRLELQRGDWHGPLQYWNATNFRWNIVPFAPAGPLVIKFDVSPDNVVTGMYFGLGADVTRLGRKGASGRGGRGRAP
jgi:CubicO group peptidase (beta-lactamase class C family)